jgi:hypothetical protein
MRFLFACAFVWGATSGAVALAGAPPPVATADAPAAAAAADKHGFALVRTVDGKRHVLLGSAVSGDYTLALYVEESEARRHFPALAARAGGRGKAKLLASDHAQAFVLWGRFTKLVVVRPTKEQLPSARLRDVLSAGMAEDLGDKASPELKKWSEELVALFDRDLRDGEELMMAIDGDGHITVELGAERREGPQSPKLGRAALGTWLVVKSAAELRRSLLDRIELLGK